MVNQKNKAKKAVTKFYICDFLSQYELSPRINKWNNNYEKLTTNEKKRTKGFYPN